MRSIVPVVAAASVLAAGCGAAPSLTVPAADPAFGAAAAPASEFELDQPGHLPVDDVAIPVRDAARQLLGPERYAGMWVDRSLGGGTVIVGAAGAVSDDELAVLQRVAGEVAVKVVGADYSLAELEDLVRELSIRPELAALHFSIHEPANVVWAQAEDLNAAEQALRPWQGRPIELVEILSVEPPILRLPG
jgi:hypothetical protein